MKRDHTGYLLAFDGDAIDLHQLAMGNIVQSDRLWFSDYEGGTIYAAAPDLLAACEAMSQASTLDPRPDSAWGKALIQLRAAISKAKGNQQEG